MTCFKSCFASLVFFMAFCRRRRHSRWHDKMLPARGQNIPAVPLPHHVVCTSPPLRWTIPHTSPHTRFRSARRLHRPVCCDGVRYSWALRCVFAQPQRGRRVHEEAGSRQRRWICRWDSKMLCIHNTELLLVWLLKPGNPKTENAHPKQHVKPFISITEAALPLIYWKLISFVSPVALHSYMSLSSSFSHHLFAALLLLLHVYPNTTYPNRRGLNGHRLGEYK